MIEKRILLIEDDHDLGATLSENLQLEGYFVDWAKDGLNGLQKANKNTHDLILLDLMLPGMDGYEVLKSFRQKSNLPVFIISAKSQLQDKIKGLELSADDYLTKPFHLKELFLKIKNILKRQDFTTQANDRIAIGNSTVDLKKLLITNNECSETISESEAKALLYFYNNANQYLSRDQIMDHVWGFHKNINTRSIDNMIVKFRKIIEEQPNNPQYFISKRGMGYSLQLNKENI